MDDNSKLEKKKIRSLVRSINQSLPADYVTASNEGIFRGITSLPEYQEAKVIFTFVGVGDEVDTMPIIRDALARGKRVAAPRCRKLGLMDALEIQDPDADLEEGMYHLIEPKKSCPVIQPEAFDFAVVPCCTVTEEGWRLGFGGGFYDRYLPLTRMFRACVCRARVMQPSVPVDAHDQKVDAVVTDDRVIRVSR